jgi:hypothetical protein
METIKTGETVNSETPVRFWHEMRENDVEYK